MRSVQDKPSGYWKDRASIMQGLALYCMRKGDEKGHLKYCFMAMVCITKAGLAHIA